MLLNNLVTYDVVATSLAVEDPKLVLLRHSVSAGLAYAPILILLGVLHNRLSSWGWSAARAELIFHLLRCGLGSDLGTCSRLIVELVLLDVGRIRLSCAVSDKTKLLTGVKLLLILLLPAFSYLLFDGFELLLDNWYLGFLVLSGLLPLRVGLLLALFLH